MGLLGSMCVHMMSFSVYTEIYLHYICVCARVIVLVSVYVDIYLHYI